MYYQQLVLTVIRYKVTSKFEVTLASYQGTLTEWKNLIFLMTISYQDSLQSFLCLCVQNRSKHFSEIQLSISNTRMFRHVTKPISFQSKHFLNSFTRRQRYEVILDKGIQTYFLPLQHLRSGLTIKWRIKKVKKMLLLLGLNRYSDLSSGLTGIPRSPVRSLRVRSSICSWTGRNQVRKEKNKDGEKCG